MIWLQTLGGLLSPRPGENLTRLRSQPASTLGFLMVSAVTSKVTKVTKLHILEEAGKGPPSTLSRPSQRHKALVQLIFFEVLGCHKAVTRVSQAVTGPWRDKGWRRGFPLSPPRRRDLSRTGPYRSCQANGYRGLVGFREAYRNRTGIRTGSSG